jgi:uncharacterized protein YbjT (DUF2867 family)
MKVLIFGATGMIGQGALRESLLDPEVEAVLTVGRSASAARHAKLREIVRPDLFDLAAIEPELRGFDACFYCLGVTSGGLSEAEYTRLTYTLAVSIAETLSRLNPSMTFIFVSGAGADSSEKGRIMWARIKGKTENAILALPFRAAWVFRPAVVRPEHGERSRTTAYRVLYAVLNPVLPLLQRLVPAYVVTTAEIGRAMLTVGRRGAPKKVLESADIAAVARNTR